jgi:hypothetical protein
MYDPELEKKQKVYEERLIGLAICILIPISNKGFDINRVHEKQLHDQNEHHKVEIKNPVTR